MKKPIEQNFSVPFRYQVHFTEKVFDQNNPLFASLLGGGATQPKTLFVLDQGVATAHPELTRQIRSYAEAHADQFKLPCAPLLVPGGEQVKNQQTWVDAILEATHIHGIDRHSYVIGIGGGAVLDMTGYAAAIAHRGVRHIRVPTTVLAQNDSGVGVKNGINAFGKKNYLGTFAPPYAVINDTTFLQTLDDRDWRAGMAEAVKVALVKDAAFFQWMEVNAKRLAARELEPMVELIYRCAELHMQHIAGGDPFEMGSSRPLDFGHWAAHKLEHLTRYEMRHGEAVAVGIALDTTYSALKGHLHPEGVTRVLNLLTALGFDTYVPALEQPDLLNGLQEFHEHLGGKLTITLQEEIGRGFEVHEMDTALVTEAIDRLRTSTGSERLSCYAS
ncbi:3-dehydroquinate synthase [Microbulbifer rhizosphaerae]|uniref:3-dehydroquinate synthase n=1 Tax=Microbulbifer rhizosphaerae TaxID=1562603 RepID=A0A7W4WGJ4_9GAMM|nr:3-dehydroquinate synthase [Microbulbifer rhizosphaerae]MBB3063278.1 3-dehydroquinate synthase [Microbulbifer rhizosphaerae]